MKQLLIFLFSIFLFVGCQTPTKVEKQTCNYSITLNKEFIVELPSNPSTGYSWHWANASSSAKIQKTNDSFTSTASPNIVGAGGIQKIRFKGVKRGFETIKLVYIRSWERGAPPAKTMIYTVEIL